MHIEFCFMANWNGSNICIKEWKVGTNIQDNILQIQIPHWLVYLVLLENQKDGKHDAVVLLKNKIISCVQLHNTA